jgi:hypothetical protein
MYRIRLFAHAIKAPARDPKPSFSRCVLPTDRVYWAAGGYKDENEFGLERFAKWKRLGVDLGRGLRVGGDFGRRLRG